MIRVFIGYDRSEPVAFSVCAHSIHARASEPVSVTPIMLSQLGYIFNREPNPLQSTDFAFSRFLVPLLSEYEGWSLFIDGDMIVMDDIATLWSLRDERFAIQVVKHEHCPKETIKFNGATQTRYEKKNWSSVILFNNRLCTALTQDYVNTASGLELHQFKWLADDDLIGALPQRWNHLADYTAQDKCPALIHYTAGGPYFENYKDCEYSSEWFDELNHMLYVDDVSEQAEHNKAS